MAFITNNMKVNSDKAMGWKTRELCFQPWHRYRDFPWTPHPQQYGNYQPSHTTIIGGFARGKVAEV